MNANLQKTDSLPVPGADALAQSHALRERIQEAIAAAGGWLPFDRYMELALYAPGLGYYSGGSTKFGRRPEDGSDFITAPELSPLFAATLANALAEALAASNTRAVMEFGAGSGKLAAGLLAALEQTGTPCDSYTIVELSGSLRERQRATLAALVPQLASRVHWIDALPASFSGVMIGNEVLDAMPVRLIARLDGVWHERGVVDAAGGAPGRAAPAGADILAPGRDNASGRTPAGGNFAFADRPLSGSGAVDAVVANAVADGAADGVAEIIAAIGGEHDYVSETHSAARAFTRTIGSVLTRGALLLIDYGFARHEYYHEQRATGTLMCHYRHRAHGDPFFYPGLQDITTHIDFSGIAQAGIDAGLDLLGYCTQARFLINCGITDALGELDPDDVRAFLPAANAVQKLLSEAEMGELFKVIAFGRGLTGELTAFAQGDRAATL